MIWKKNERNITLNGHYFNHTIDADREELTRKNQLQIRRALRNDNGNYSCFVKNIAGENESTVLLIVLGMFCKCVTSFMRCILFYHKMFLTELWYDLPKLQLKYFYYHIKYYHIFALESYFLALGFFISDMNCF